MNLIETERNRKPIKREKYKNINHNKLKQIEFLKKITSDFPEIASPDKSVSPTFSKTNHNVGIVFWYLPEPEPEPDPHPNPTPYPQTRQIEILIGMETCYLTDKVVPEIKSILQKYQIYSPHHHKPKENRQKTYQEEENVYQIFSKRAKLLTKEMKFPVYFDKPVKHTSDIWKIQYRVTNETPKYGILKGSIEEFETIEQAIQREIHEELFPFHTEIPLNIEKCKLIANDIPYNQDILHIFHYPLTKTEKEMIEKNIQHLQTHNYGELVHYQFRPMHEIFTSPQSTQPNHHLMKKMCNGKTRFYIKEFYEYIETYLTDQNDIPEQQKERNKTEREEKG